MRERDLFGERPHPSLKGRGKKNGLVDLELQLHAETEKAWLLSDDGDKAKAEWLPKSQAERGEGRDQHIWTMPAWIATDRGWV